MASVTFDHVYKRFGDVVAVNDLTIEVEDKEFLVFVGPSGCGKTTSLRLLAGLEEITEGNIMIGDRVVNDVPPKDRDIAMVFQSYALYPHMSVYDNMAFGLKLRKTPKADIDRRVKEAAGILDIEHLLDRKPKQLSGGQRQRVAVGRAIVREPAVFLFDEPLSNLDAKLRETLRVELEHIQKTQGSTTLFVTHDQVEALTMADRIGVLNEGRLVQIGTPNDIYDRPANIFVAKLVGSPSINLIDAVRENGTAHVPDSQIQVPVDGASAALPEQFILGVRPEDIQPDPEGQYSGQVTLVEPLGVETVIHIQSGERTIQSLVSGMSALRIGDTVHFKIIRDRLHFFNRDGNRVA
jgi:multiple sugar transport system ATP-binding protein